MSLTLFLTVQCCFPFSHPVTSEGTLHVTSSIEDLTEFKGNTQWMATYSSLGEASGQ